MKDTVPEDSRQLQIIDSYRVVRGDHAKICKSCWREEVHSYQSLTLPSFITYMIFTAGMFWFLWPSRCVCCGKKRYG